MSINGLAIEALATIGSGIALFVSAIFVLRQLREQSKEKFASGTSVTFEIWMDHDFSACPAMGSARFERSDVGCVHGSQPGAVQ